jgi:hypothetical protein
MHTSKQLLQTDKLVKNPKSHISALSVLASWLKSKVRVLADMILGIERRATNENL